MPGRNAPLCWTVVAIANELSVPPFVVQEIIDDLSIPAGATADGTPIYYRDTVDRVREALDRRPRLSRFRWEGRQ